MAQLDYDRLISLIRTAPDYQERLEAEVPVENVLYVCFAPPPAEGVESETVELANGCELVLDRGRDGKVYGIEIV